MPSSLSIEEDWKSSRAIEDMWYSEILIVYSNISSVTTGILMLKNWKMTLSIYMRDIIELKIS